MCQDFRVKEKPKFYNPVKPELGLTINTGYPIHWSYLIIKIPCSKFGKWQKPFFEINICTQSTTEISLRFCKFLFLNSGSNWRSIRLTDWPKRQTHKNTADKGLNGRSFSTNSSDADVSIKIDNVFNYWTNGILKPGQHVRQH